MEDTMENIERVTVSQDSPTQDDDSSYNGEEEDIEEDEDDKNYDALVEKEGEEAEGNGITPNENNGKIIIESSEEEMVLPGENDQNEVEEENNNGDKKATHGSKPTPSRTRICYVCNRTLTNNKCYRYDNENYKKIYDWMMDGERAKNPSLVPPKASREKIVGDCCYRKAKILMVKSGERPPQKKKKKKVSPPSNKRKKEESIEPSSKRRKNSKEVKHHEAELVPTISTSNVPPAKQQVNVFVYIYGTPISLVVDPEISMSDFKAEVKSLADTYLGREMELHKLYLVQERPVYGCQDINALILPTAWDYVLPLPDNLEFETAFW